MSNSSRLFRFVAGGIGSVQRKYNINSVDIAIANLKPTESLLLKEKNEKEGNNRKNKKLKIIATFKIAIIKFILFLFGLFSAFCNTLCVAEKNEKKR